MSDGRNPDIQRLLASLRGEAAAVASTSNHDKDRTYQPSAIPGLGLLPSNEREHQPSTAPPSSRPSQPDLVRDRSATPVVPDASTITTWPTALKHVTKYIVPNEKAASKIKHLIEEQHKHERQWWTGREAIVARHSGRAGNQAKVADLLKSLGGASVPVAAHNPQADKAELEAYDRKVYKSLTDMTADFDRQLRALQVPFFAIKHELVILEDGVQKEGSLKGRVDRGELRDLQTRMVETLQDLLSDE